jgi:hypothetical protein
MKLSLILAKISYLHGLINPDWVDGNPGQPGPVAKPSEAAIDLLLSEQVRAISQHLRNAELGKKLNAVGKNMATDSLGRLGAALDGDDENICPPYRIGPHLSNWWDWAALNPQPLPPKEVTPGAMLDVLIALSLREIAGLTSSEKFNKAIQGAGQEIIRASAGRIFDDYCGTPVPPRIDPGPQR